MAWLLREDDVLAAVEDRPPGRGGSMKGACIVRAPALVHTWGATAAVDVAHCVSRIDDNGKPVIEVRRVGTLRPRRVGRPVLRSGVVVLAPDGAFERWRLQVGDHLEVREV